MRLRIFSLGSLGLCLLAAFILFSGKPSSRVSVPVGAANPQVLASYGKLPLYFIENQGQLDPRVAYYIQGGDKSIYFTGRGVTFALTGAGDEKPSSEALVRPASYRGTGVAREFGPHGDAQRWVVKLDFVDANPNARPVGQEPTAAVISYFKGPREEWTTGLPTYASLVYRDLWPGIDLVYSGVASRLKYTFVVQPGADPSQIKLAYRGASRVWINEAGQLEVSTPLESFQEDKPYVYQEVEGQRQEVEAAYSLEGETSGGVQFGFRVGDYDPHKVLVLDPVILLYAGYIGGSESDAGEVNRIAVDSAGNAYVTGWTKSNAASFPVTVGPDLTFNGGFDLTDAFVAKVNASGTALVYAGYIGGSGDEGGTGIAVDSAGNAYVSGFTSSTEVTFPVTVGPDLTFNGGEEDAFVAKVNASGTSLLYAGYIGGSGSDFGLDIAVDTTGNAYVTGETHSTEATFPVTVGPDLTFNDSIFGEADAFVAKVNPMGTALLYAGYIGGSSEDAGVGIAVDSTGNAYVIGTTASTEATFPVTVGPDLTFNGGEDDVFVANVDASGTALIYAGYIGGSGIDQGLDIAVDTTGNAYVTGLTSSTEATFPVTVGPDLTFNGGSGSVIGVPIDAFVAKVNLSGTALDYAGYIGGSSDDAGVGIAVDTTGNAYVTGATASTEATFPVAVGPDLTFNGGSGSMIGVPIDAFVAKVNPSGTALVYAGYIGGSGDDLGSGIAVDTTGDAYVTGETTSTEATFPVTVGPDLTYNDQSEPDVFVAKISGALFSLDLTSLTFSGQTVGTSSDPQTVTLTNTSGAAQTLTSIEVSGDFAETNTCGGPIASGESCTISVTFAPTAEGERTGDLTVIDGTGGTSVVALTGAGNVPAVSLSMADLAFGDQGVGTSSAAETVTLTNTGEGVLTITSIAVSGDFAQTNDCASLAASASCTVNVTFNPTAGGARTGTLTIDSNDPASPHTVNLTGNGTEFTVTVPEGGDTVTITAGETANYELVLAPAGFVGTVTLTCTGAPAGTTCTVTPNMVTLNGATDVTIMVSVTTTAPSLLMPPAGPQSGMPWLPWLLGLGMTVAMAEALRRRTAWAGRLMPQRAWPVLAATLLFVALWASCGSGAPTPPPTGGGVPTGGTPTGTSTLMINASSGGQVVQTIDLMLTVN